MTRASLFTFAAAAGLAAVSVYHLTGSPVYRARAVLRAAPGVVVSPSRDVEQVLGTQLWSVREEASAAGTAADAANARAHALVRRVEASATADLDAALAAVAGEISQQRGILADAKRQHRDAGLQASAPGAAGGSSRTIRLGQLFDGVRSQLIPLDAALQRLETGAEPGTIAAVALDPDVQTARNALLSAERDRARRLLRYGEEHPAIEPLDELVACARDNLRLAEDAILSSLRADRERLTVEAGVWRTAFDAAIAENLAAAPARERLRTLTAVVAAAEGRLADLQGRELELRLARERDGGGLRLVELAVPPAAPLPGAGRWFASAAIAVAALAILLGRLGRHHRRRRAAAPAPVLLQTHSWPPRSATAPARRAA
jgi:uncharacterized protein involved in exopolysaccharide biosynthesis